MEIFLTNAEAIEYGYYGYDFIVIVLNYNNWQCEAIFCHLFIRSFRFVFLVLFSGKEKLSFKIQTQALGFMSSNR